LVAITSERVLTCHVVFRLVFWRCWLPVRSLAKLTEIFVPFLSLPPNSGKKKNFEMATTDSLQILTYDLSQLILRT
jgi:hypothetical protein